MKANSMSSYKNVRLGSIVSINPESIGKGFANLKIDYVDISSVGSGTLNGTTVYEISKAPSRAKRLISHGDTILSTVRPNRRSFLFIKNPSRNMVVSTGFAVLRPSEKIDPRFLYYTVTFQSFTDYLTANAKGAAYPAVDAEIIARAEIRLPPLPTQRKIAATLSAYDDIIENNTRRIKILEEMAQALYREWFVNFRFPGHEKTKLVESELGMVPAGWEIVPVGERFTTVLGGTPSTKRPEFWEGGSIPWINSGKVNELRIIDASELITLAGLKQSSTKMMPKRTTVLAITGATLGQVNLLEIEACANQSVVGICDEENIYSEYIYLSFCEIIEQVILFASGGAQQHINKEIVNDVQIFIPPIKIMKSFNDIIHPIFDSVVNLIWRNVNLRRTRDLLLPKLISGEVENIDVLLPEIGGV